MASVIRLHVRKGDSEIQLEGDRAEVDELATAWWERIHGSSPRMGTRAGPEVSGRRYTTTPAGTLGVQHEGIDCNAQANSIKERDDFALLERHVLHARDGWNKVALILYAANVPMTSGDVCKTLQALDVKADLGHISHVLKDNTGRLTTSGVRKPGATIRYKLTGKAQKDFVEWLEGQNSKNGS